MLKLDEPFRDKDILNNLFFFNTSYLGLRKKNVFTVFGGCCGFASMNPKCCGYNESGS